MDAWQCFSRSTSNVSSVSGNIPVLFELSNSFNALLTFPFSINQANRVLFLSELWFFELSLTSLSWIVLPSTSNFSICTSFNWLSLLFKVCTLSLNFDVKDVFWSSNVGKAIRTFIEMVSCSDLNVQIFISFLISSIKRLTVDRGGNNNSDFLQRETVLCMLLIVLHYVSLGIPNILLVDSNICNGKAVVDVVSKFFESIGCFSLHTRVC